MKKRTNIIAIRVTDQELEELMNRKSRPELARWMREFCLSDEKSQNRVDPNMARVLSGIGANLNQLAMLANSGRFDKSGAVKIPLAIEKLRSELRSNDLQI